MIKKLIAGITFLFSIMLISCGGSNGTSTSDASSGGSDIQQLVEKVRNSPETLTQEDYSKMIDYLDEVAADPEKYKADINEPFSPSGIFTSCCLVADPIMSGGNTPVMDDENWARFKEVDKKMVKMKESMESDS